MALLTEYHSKFRIERIKAKHMDTHDEVKVDRNYTEEEAAQKRLHLVWGEGFMSPGGVAEVARIIGGRKIAGCKVLDIGSGAGGVDIALVQEHGVGELIGIDINPHSIELATERVRQLHLENHIRFQRVDPDTLPFAANSFDVVFSKDALLYVRDKAAFYAEIWRVLRPGGRLLISDWLTEDGDSYPPAMAEFLISGNHPWFPIGLYRLGGLVEGLGFREIELEDRHAWYQVEVHNELQRVQGPLKAKFQERWGGEATQDITTLWESFVAVVDQGALRPGHLRAVKPVASAQISV